MIFPQEKPCVNLPLGQESREGKLEGHHRETLVVIPLLALEARICRVEEVLQGIWAANSHLDLPEETLLALLREMSAEMAHSHLEL